MHQFPDLDGVFGYHLVMKALVYWEVDSSTYKITKTNVVKELDPTSGKFVRIKLD